MWWLKWCVDWSDVWIEVLCVVKWYVEWSDILVPFPCILLPNWMNVSFHFLPSLLILTSLYLPNSSNTVLLLHFISLRHTIFCRIPLAKWSPQHTAIYLTTHNTHPCPQRYSNPQSQQACRPKPTLQTARPPGSAFPLIVCFIELQLVWFCVTQIG